MHEILVGICFLFVVLGPAIAATRFSEEESDEAGS